MAGLKRSLGLPGLTFYGLGTILGAGIYSVLGAAAGEAGAAVWMSFGLAAIVALLTALSYAELATTFPKAGAEYVYLKRAFPKWPALSRATGLMVAGSGAATAATVSMAFAGYLGAPLPDAIVALGLLGAAAGVALVGIKESAGMNTIFTLIEVAGLLLVIGVGATSEGLGEAFREAPSWGGLGASALVFFSSLATTEGIVY